MLHRSSLSSALKYLAYIYSIYSLKTYKRMVIHIPMFLNVITAERMYFTFILHHLLNTMWLQASFRLWALHCLKHRLSRWRCSERKLCAFLDCALKDKQPCSTLIREKHVSRNMKQPWRGRGARILLLGAAAMTNFPQTGGADTKTSQEPAVIGVIRISSLHWLARATTPSLRHTFS